MVPWWGLLALVVVLGVITAMWATRGGIKRRRDGAADPAVESLSVSPGRLRLRITLTGAILYAAGTAVSTLATIGSIFLARSVRLTVPVSTFWPKLLPSVQIEQGGSAHVTGGGFRAADVAVSGLSMTAKLWLASGHLLQGCTYVIIGLAIAGLCYRMLRDDPFRAAVSSAVSVTSVSILVGGLGWQLCFGVAGVLASGEVLNLTSWSIENTDVVGHDIHALGWPSSTTSSFTIEFWPIYLALALAAVGGVFRYGEKLEREKERLQREAAGLV